MNIKVKSIFYTIFCGLIFSACKVPYTPTPITTNTNYLVVEGIININDSTFINLSRTVTVSSASTVKPELKAMVTIESNTGMGYTLKEVGNGVYSAPSFNLSAANQYRLRIRTSNNNIYTSDFGPAKVTPPIDSIIRDMKPDGLHISVNAHDPKNATRYYRWDYSETWQFHSYTNSLATGEGALTSPLSMSPLYPGYPALGIAVLPRTNDIYDCWAGDASANILLNSTAALSQDVVQSQPINFVVSSSEKLSVRYSINIRQYALTQDAYNFWTLLKKNTEQLGSIFDAQPTATIGNIHNVSDATEVVIGYISACTVSQTRIYINVADMPKSYITDYYNNTPYNAYTCPLDFYPVVGKDSKGNVIYPELEYLILGYPHTVEIPVNIYIPFNPLTLEGEATSSLPICVDCTLRGTNVKPAFWQ